SARDSWAGVAKSRGERRDARVKLVRERDGEVPVNRACDAVGLKRQAYYRAIKQVILTPEPLSKRQSHRKLSDEQKAILLAAMNSEEFLDQPPREVYATLLSRGEYLGSWRTMYRVLAEK